MPSASRFLRTPLLASLFVLLAVLLTLPVTWKQLKKLLPSADLGLIGAPAATAETEDNPGPDPVRAYVWLDGGMEMVGSHAGKGSSALLEMFEFDEKARTTGEAGGGGIEFTMDNNPVPVVTYGFNPNSFSESAGGRYSNFILDFTAAKGALTNFGLGDENSADGTKAAEVSLSAGKLKELFISPDYVVFPEQSREVGRNGPFAGLTIQTGKSNAAGEVTAGSTLILVRNGTEVTRKKLAGGESFSIELKRVATSKDVVAWRIEDGNGKPTHQGALGFPVRGAEAGIVTYEVDATTHLAVAAK